MEQRAYGRDGIPVSTEIQRRLEEIAEELGVPAPWPP